MLAIYLIITGVLTFFAGVEGFSLMLFCGLLIFSSSFRHFVGNVATVFDIIEVIFEILSMLG
ncbi:MAG: hypothetical protein PHD82_02055 [Candidatus Riflebacteria bacterium]|jgi:hypothetical protein|nr:hypothetical protein [Candidatus Riflebacteria bacterium]